MHKYIDGIATMRSAYFKFINLIVIYFVGFYYLFCNYKYIVYFSFALQKELFIHIIAKLAEKSFKLLVARKDPQAAHNVEIYSG